MKIKCSLRKFSFIWYLNFPQVCSTKVITNFFGVIILKQLNNNHRNLVLICQCRLVSKIVVTVL